MMSVSVSLRRARGTASANIADAQVEPLREDARCHTRGAVNMSDAVAARQPRGADANAVCADVTAARKYAAPAR